MIRLLKKPTPIITALLLLVIQSAYSYPVIPAFNSPAKKQQFPGKQIWADLITDDVAKATEFYTDLFGWESETLAWEDKTYALLKKDGKAFAGIYYRASVEGDTEHGLWVPYMSVPDINNTMKAAANAGGTHLLDATILNRGTQAIYRDNQGAFIGFMESSSGDPDDDLAEFNEFIWLQLWVHDIDLALLFYKLTVDLDDLRDDTHHEVYSHMLVSDTNFRATVSEFKDDYEGRSTWLSFVRVENVQATLDKATSLGGSIFLAPNKNYLDGKMAIILDVMGAPIAIMEYEYKEGK